MTVFVVTDSEAGWDCVEGVFSIKQLAIDYCVSRDPNWDYNARLIIHELNVI